MEAQSNRERQRKYRQNETKDAKEKRQTKDRETKRRKRQIQTNEQKAAASVYKKAWCQAEQQVFMWRTLHSRRGFNQPI
jgi:hypothetical protein